MFFFSCLSSVWLSAEVQTFIASSKRRANFFSNLKKGKLKKIGAV